MKPHELALLAIVAVAVLWEGFRFIKEQYRRYKANAPIRLSRREREERLNARLNRIEQNRQLQKHQWR